MKINGKFEADNPIVFPRQILRIMKLTIVIMTACLLQVSALTKAQITMKTSSQSVQKVLETISIQSGYDFVYSTADLKRLNVTNINLNNATIETALKVCFADLPLQYEIADKTVMIKRKDEPSYIDKLIERFQSIDVTGRIVDAEGKALPGATVKVKATGKGVSTELKGNFHLKNVEEGAVLVVSYTGYISKEVKAEKDMGSVVLEISLSKLDEVQVIAYGTTTQRLSTGNVTTIKADVIEKQPVNNPLLALQGRVPGLFIEQATGFAGTGVKVRIQGQNSINNGSDPLYVIDGVVYPSQLLAGGNVLLGNSGGSQDDGTGNPLSFINPADIESIDVLKDADATSIYGSRAANGAILITTKKGKVGDTRVNLNLQSGWAKVPRKLDLMNSEQYLEMRREALKNDGILVPASTDYDLNGAWDNTRSTDWQKEFIGKTAGYKDLNASVSGGGNLTSFLIGTGYHRETNVFPGDFSDRKASLHFNIDNTSANQKFKIQFSGNYLYDDNRLPNYDFTRPALNFAPIVPSLYLPDGSINWQTNTAGKSIFSANPIGQMFGSFSNQTTNLMANMAVSYEIIRGLNLTSTFSYNNLGSEMIQKNSLKSSRPELLSNATRVATLGNSLSKSWAIEPQLSYNVGVSKGQLSVLFGATINRNDRNGSSITGRGFLNDQVMDDILSAPAIQINSTISSLYKSNSFFGRVNYNWQDKYIVNFTGRRDGSSRFGPENQFHNFASLAGAWLFSNERLIRDNLTFMSFGKVRASYGTTGSDQIGDYQFLSLFAPISQEVLYQGTAVYTPYGLTNPYLQWEETKKLQFGLDLGFAKERILLNANYYRNHSSNQLSGYPLPTTTGFSGITKNQDYKIRNSGWELMLTTSNIQSRDFGWSTIINLTIPQTLMVAYPDVYKSSMASYALVGRPLSVLPVYHFLGVDPATGAYQFADKNGNPTFSPNNPEDKTTIIDLAPKFYGGFNNTFSYKGFQLDVMFSFVKQIAQNYLFGNSTTPGKFNSGNGIQQNTLLNRWQQPGDVVSIQKYTTGSAFDQSLINVKESDAAWSDASYIRVKNMSLSYNLPDRWTKSARMQNCSLFIQGQNLFTITGYAGLDPETKSSTTLPTLRVVTVGFKAVL
jgi:TonB-linked SusC/RagA family outer membrane protein